MSLPALLSLKRLYELFELRDGKLFRRVRAANMAAGVRAGCKSKDGYRLVRVDDVLYKEHRIVFAMAYGRWPEKHLDHKNLVRDDNRPENLREATAAQNIQNCSVRSDNRSGSKGVYWAEYANKWRARITVDGKHIHLGYHRDKELAELIYAEAARKFHGEFARIL